MENRKGSEIFLGVIGIATLVVAIIGATFAYFSANAESEDDAIKATSTSVDLGLETITADTVIASSLIPAYDNIAKLGEEKDTDRCIDDKGNEICSVYTFMIGNPSTTTAQTVYGTINVQSNSFDNLYFRIYDITDGNETEIVTPSIFNDKAPTETDDGKTIAITKDTDVTYNIDATKNNSGTLSIATLTTTLAPSATAPADVKTVSGYTLNTVDGRTNVKKYKVVVWLRDIGYDQPDDTSSSLIAGINFTTGTNTGVTGVIGAVAGVNFPGEETAG